MDIILCFNLFFYHYFKLVGIRLTKPTSDISGSIALYSVKETNENI